MLHPSYTDLMAVVNSDIEEGEQPVVQSRYSIVIATAKRARQIIEGDEPMVDVPSKKPLSYAVEELYEGKVKILGNSEDEEDDIMDYDSDIMEMNLDETHAYDDAQGDASEYDDHDAQNDEDEFLEEEDSEDFPDGEE